MTKDEADNALRQAIMDHAKAYDMQAADELLDEYAIISSWQPLEARNTRSYTLHFHTEHIPAHVAAGLFSVAQNILMDQQNEDDDD